MIHPAGWGVLLMLLQGAPSLPRFTRIVQLEATRFPAGGNLG